MTETRRATAHHPSVAGAVVLDQLRSAREILGKEAIARAFARLPDDARAQLEEGTLSIAWCDLRMTRKLHEEVAKEAGVDVDTWHRRIVRHGIERTFSTVWRFFLKVVSADAIVRRAAVVYRKTFDTGSMTARILEPGHSEAILTGWPNVPEFDLDGLAVGIETTLRVAGRKHVLVTYVRTPDGACFDIRTETRTTS